jgi:hypothetical protein
MACAEESPRLPNALPRPEDELERLKKVWEPPRGWRALTAVDNTAIGLWYIEIVVGILRTRPLGMTLDKMPIYPWAMLIVGAMIIFAFPPVILATALLELERPFTGPSSSPSAVAMRCCGSICPGCSGIPMFTSSFCLRLVER